MSYSHGIKASISRKRNCWGNACTETLWGQAIAEAGQMQLSRAELERVESIVIGDARFVSSGLRK